jgi:hypothetical protein
LSQDEDIDALSIDFDFQRINCIVVFQHFARGGYVAVNQRVHCPSQCRFSLAAKTKHSVA